MSTWGVWMNPPASRVPDVACPRCQEYPVEARVIDDAGRHFIPRCRCYPKPPRCPCCGCRLADGRCGNWVEPCPVVGNLILLDYANDARVTYELIRCSPVVAMRGEPPGLTNT